MPAKFSFTKFVGKADRLRVRSNIPGLIGGKQIPAPPPGLVDEIIDVFLFRTSKALDVTPHQRKRWKPPPKPPVVEPWWYYRDKAKTGGHYMLESAIEGAVERWAKTNRIMTRKMNGAGNRSWPDRMYIFPDGKIAFIEFKATGRKLTVSQKELHDKLKAKNVDVTMCDNKHDAMRWLSQWLPDGPAKPIPPAHTTRNIVGVRKPYNRRTK